MPTTLPNRQCDTASYALAYFSCVSEALADVAASHHGAAVVLPVYGMYTGVLF
ncbi:MAG: hypothetical protein NC253_13085 [Ruminococcus sp.]|nr:hypothetical protein [Ruminococcus sp.]MCM1382656.1 hypothetical protein [Muribaculaceae bacterium]